MKTPIFNSAILCLLITASICTSSGDEPCEFINTEVKCKNATGRFLKYAGSRYVNKIYILKCDLSELRTEDFLAFPSLTLVSIQKSYIAFPTHEYHFFEGLRKLKDLRIENCNVTEKVKLLFAKNNDITSLSLPGNNISVVTNEFFGHLRQINNIDLSGNEIEYIEIGVFERLNTLRTLNLASNRLGTSFDPQYLVLTSFTCIVCRDDTTEKCTEDDVTRCKINSQIDQLWWKTKTLDHINLKNNPVCAAIASDYQKPNVKADIHTKIINVTLNDCITGSCSIHESRNNFLLGSCNGQNSEIQFVGRDVAKTSTVHTPNIIVEQKEEETKEEDEEPIKLSIASISSLLGFVAVVSVLIGHLGTVLYKNMEKSAEQSTTSEKDTASVPLMDNKYAHQDNVNVDSRLHEAVVEDDLKKVKDLLASGVNPNSQDANGELPVHYAARVGNDKIIKEHRKYSVNVDALNRNGQAAIHFAVGRGNLSIIKCLLNNGSNINVKNWDGNTPLTLAVRDGHIGIADFLIINGADVNERNFFHQLPIHFAARNGHTTILKLLISKGSERAPHDDRGYTPLHYAARRGYVDTAKILLEKGELVDVRNSGQNTPLHKAAKGGQMKMIKFLLENNADVQASNILNQRPHNIANLHQHEECEKLLLQRLYKIRNPSSTSMHRRTM